MQKFSLSILTLVAVLLLSLPAQAVSPTRLGEKRFERAWWVLMLDNRTKAKEYFAEAADAYAEALAAEPRGRTIGFVSNLARAGMSFYYVERYDEALSVMSEAYDSNPDMWEAAIYSALASAAKGDKADTEAWLEKFLNISTGQSVLSTAATDQLKSLRDGTTSLPDVLSALDEAAWRQFRRNVSTLEHNTAIGADACSGAYWWRYAKKPCRRLHFFGD